MDGHTYTHAHTHSSPQSEAPKRDTHRCMLLTTLMFPQRLVRESCSSSHTLHIHINGGIFAQPRLEATLGRAGVITAKRKKSRRRERVRGRGRRMKRVRAPSAHLFLPARSVAPLCLLTLVSQQPIGTSLPLADVE